MTPERQRIQEDLSGRLEGEVRCDDIFVQMYANDASIFEIRPLGVVRPRNKSDVVACVQYAAEHQIPLHPRGAGTGLAGGCLGPGLVVDFSHAMRRIIAITDETVRVQPGAVLEQVNRQLARRGRQIGPDPATSKVTTIGGMLSVDGSGSRWPCYGSIRDHVGSLQIVLADGEVLEVSQHEVQPITSDSQTSRRDALVQRLDQLLQRSTEEIAIHRPHSLVDASGYCVEGLQEENHEGTTIDLARLLVGSEGTLGLITEATLKTVPLPAHRGAMLLFFDRLEKASRAALEMRRFGVSTCDLMDRRLLSLARETNVRFDVLLPEEAESLLFVECQGDRMSEVRDRLEQVKNYVTRRKRLAFGSRVALDKQNVDLFWGLVREVVPTLYRLQGFQRPLPFIEDIAVPPESLPKFLVQAQNVFKKHLVTASFFAHATHGQLHLRPFLDMANPEDVVKMRPLAEDLYDEVESVQGTISGGHGDGLSRTWRLRRQAGPLYPLLREIKQLFDPREVLNPGKIVAATPQQLGDHLRPVEAVQPFAADQKVADQAEGSTPQGGPTTTSLQLVWNDQELDHVARNCNGCAGCRSTASNERMCPIFRFAPAEEASPRAKANLLRSVLTGQLDARCLADEALMTISRLCVNCHQCRIECPAEVDIPRLVLESKAQYVADHGLRWSDWFLARLDIVASWASPLSPLVNSALASRRARWLLEKMTGVARGRKLPPLAARSFLRQAARRRLTRPTRRTSLKVAYFVDLYANWFDTQLAEAVVKVLEHNGVSVYVHPKQMQSAMALISMGAVEKASQIVAQNASVLADAVRQGYHVVTSEPAAAMCLSREYTQVMNDDDVQLVAENTSEVCTYLWRMHQKGQLELDLKPINATIGYHQPCHSRALAAGSPGENLLRLIPGLTVDPIDQGCSGMAGTFGLKRENYRNSLRAGWSLISAMRSPTIQVGATECSACKLQMEQGTSKPTLHPLKILALAYGVMPEVALLLTARSEELVST